MSAYQGVSLENGRSYRISREGRSHRLSPHFVLGEFASKDGADEVLVHDSLLGLLEAIRCHFDKPVVINSGYRSRSHNRNVGGASSSRHIYGLAADIVVRDVPPAQVAEYAEQLGAGGIGRYRTFTHVDVQGRGRRWGNA